MDMIESGVKGTALRSLETEPENNLRCVLKRKQDQSGRKQDQSGRKPGQSGRKQDQSGRKQDQSGRKQDKTRRKQDRSGRKQDRSGRKQDRSRRKQDRSGCKQDQLGRKQDRSGRKCELELARGKKQQGTFVNGTFVNGSEPRTIAQWLHVPQRDLEDHSHTAGCPKCDFIMAHGNEKDAHNYNDSEACGVSSI